MSTQAAALLSRDELADSLRLDRSAISVVDPRLDLLKRGVIVGITAAHWSPNARLTDQDLGLVPVKETPGEDTAPATEDPIQLGHKVLLPRKLAAQLSSVVRGLRETAYDSGFKTGWGWFVPAPAWNEFVVRFKVAEEQFFAFRNMLCATYDEWTAEVERIYQSVAKESYERTRVLNDETLAGVSMFEYVDAYVTAIRNLIPPVDELRASFKSGMTLQMIPLKEYLERSLPEVVEQNAQALMERAVLEQAREKKTEYIDSFFKDVTVQLRSYVYDTVAAALESFKTNSTITGPSVRSLKALVERVRTLNFTDDTELEAGISQIEDLLAIPSKERDNEDVARSLSSLAVVTRASLLDLGEKPRTIRHLDVEDQPSVESITRARRNLGVLATEDVPALVRASRTLKGEEDAL